MINATLIYNPAAGQYHAIRERQIQAVAAKLRDLGLETTLLKTDGRGSARALAREAVRLQSEAVLVCGGDGTVNEAVNALAGTTTPLGILPGGTANTAARELHLPYNLVAVAEQLPRWRPRQIPLGRARWNANGKEQERYFLSLAGAGFDAHVIRELSLDSKAWLGVMAYVGEALKQVWQYPFPPLLCRADNREYNATFVAIQRTRLYGGWIQMAPHSDLSKPVLTSCLFQSAEPARYLAYAAATLVGQHLRLKDVTVMETSSLACAPAVPGSDIFFELDGDLAGQLPVIFDVAPEPLTLLVP